jgi:mannose-6-phosphate isomerase-like protein (cupin superfamily)
MEPFIITLNDTVSEYTTYSHEGEKFLFILKGTAEILLDDEHVILGEGDSIYFDSTMKHRFLSKDGSEVKILSIVTQ